ncbi:FixH family protein [Gottfriedia acidiceleris]
MKKLLYIFVTMLCILLVCSGCGKKAEFKSSPFLDQIQLSINEKKLTNKDQTHVYQVNLVNSDGKEVDVDSVNFKMEMKSMNHHVEASMKKINTGIYEVSLELPMEGTWSKQITLKKGKNERKVSIR